MSSKPLVSITPLLAVAAVVALCAGQASDFSSVKREQPKLPALNAESQLYGAFLFGPEKHARVWAVLDKSDKGATVYNVLYLDLNGDGDLTQPGERFKGKSEGAGSRVEFLIGNFAEPGTGRTHTDFKITWSPERVSYRMNWLGGKLTMGPYPTDGEHYKVFTTSAATAPSFVPGNDGPFQFQHWLSGAMSRGADADFKVFMGNLGSGPGTFSCVDQQFLPLNEFVNATLICRDSSGKELRVTAALKDRC